MFKKDVQLFANWRRYIISIIAGEISTLTRYYDRVIHWQPRSEDPGLLFNQIDSKEKHIVLDESSLPDLSGEKKRKTAILLNGTLNYHFDIQHLLTQIKPKLSRSSRLLLIAYNPYLSWLYRLANKLGIRKGEIPTTFVTRVDIANFAELSGFSIVRQRNIAYCPWKLLGIGNLLNRLLPCIPGLRWLCFAYLLVLRPIIPESSPFPSISCIIPARNERGNIENVLKRLPRLPGKIEVIFVEGHSSDGTWEEIQHQLGAYQDKFLIKALKQKGKGKGDAVRLGFSGASGDLLTILDADLSMPPEMLLRFYQAYCDGHGDFINGSRLVYPMEGDAMRALNRLGNIFFAKVLSWILDVRLSDSLCGTKLMARHDYESMVSWRQDFGDVDPFGDFEIIFPAAILGLGIINVPIRYLARTYGTTNINRFRHGFMLLRMTVIAFFKIKIGARRADVE